MTRPEEVIPDPAGVTGPSADVATSYDPTAEPGDHGWREPASDEEAGARTAWIKAQPRSPESEAFFERVAVAAKQPEPVFDAAERMELARLAHDPEELAEAQEAYRTELAAAEARERAQRERQHLQRHEQQRQRERGNEEAEL